jgi:cyclohexanecarboxyl-CoA dehydrogenase
MRGIGRPIERTTKMDFGLNSDQQMLQSTLAEFARRELAPAYAARDADVDLPRSLINQLGQMGLLAPTVPPESGGQGLDHVSLGIAHEEIAKGDFNAAYVMMLSALVGVIVAEQGDDRQRAAFLPEICSGRVLPALAVTEPGRGSDAAHVTLSARREGDEYVLDGEKSSISFASYADCALVMARTGTLAAGARGVSAFYVDLHSSGVSRTRFADLGTRAIGRGQLFFDSVRVPIANRIGPEGAGFIEVMQGFDFSRALIGLMCIGAAEQSVAETCQYVTDRQAFGASLARFEGVSFPLAEAAVKLRAARLLCYESLWLKDRGLPHTIEAAGCKWLAPELATAVLHQCLLLHGHLGFSRDLPHQQRMRDVIGLEIGDGTAQIMKLVVARGMLGKVARPY